MLWAGGPWNTRAQTVEASPAFEQGVCGQAVNESITLTQDIGPCPGTGLTVYGNNATIDGDGFKVIGSGEGIGVLIATPVVGEPDIVPPPSEIVIQRLFVRGFEIGIATQAEPALITESDVRSNDIGISLAGSTTVTNTIIDGNGLGISLVSPDQAVYHNLILGNGTQIGGDTDGSAWQGEEGYGNYWGDYWGVDDGSGGGVAGDFVGDTRLPHQGVDWAPLLDPSIPQAYGDLICGDFWGPTLWLVWRGGWSPADLQVTDPFGRRLSNAVNEMGISGFYAETDSVVSGHTLAQMVVAPCTINGSVNGVYTLAMTALANLDYDLTWFASRAGERLVTGGVVGRAMASGTTETVTLHLDQATGPHGEWISGTVTSTGPTPALLDFTGFFQPVDNLVWNKAKAGQAIPVKFSLAGDRGLGIFAAGFPTATQTVCPGAGTFTDAIETYASAAGGSALAYDAASGQYTYVWKSDKAWAGKCYTFELGLNDGSSHSFRVQFTR
jgi:hypothetical protein